MLNLMQEGDCFKAYYSMLGLYEKKMKLFLGFRV